jgi:hypothetical protein
MEPGGEGPRVGMEWRIWRRSQAEVQADVAEREAVRGVEPITERPSRESLKAAGWGRQRERWRGA